MSFSGGGMSAGARLASAGVGGGGLDAPLLSKQSATSVDSTDYSDYGDSDALSVDSREVDEPTISLMDGIKAAVACIVAIAGASASVSAMVTAPAIMTYVAGGVCTAVAPVVAYKETVLVKVPGTRRLINWLRDEANRLKSENDRLSLEIDELENQVGRVQTVEGKLSAITRKQGQNVDQLVELVKENGEILKKMRDVTKAVALQDIMRIVVNSDTDGDFHIDDDELKHLTLKIQHQLFTHGVHLNAVAFEQAIHKSNRSVDSVLRLCEGLFNQDEEVAELPMGVHGGEHDFDKEEGEMFVFEYKGSTRGSVVAADLRSSTYAVRSALAAGDLSDIDSIGDY